jgi:HSP20 family molecular chaperone IbpA
MIEYVIEYLEAIKDLNEQFGLKAVLDPRGDSIILVSNDDDSIPVVWLNEESLDYNSSKADVEFDALAAIAGFKEDDLKVEDSEEA